MVTVAEVTAAATQLAGLTVIVAGIAAAAAFVYRWYVREPLPDGLAVLVGLSVVAVSIGTTAWLNEVIGGSDSLISATAALRNIGVFVVCAAGAYAGAFVGDRIARNVSAATGGSVIDQEVSTLVEAVGRVITVELPEEIDDVVGYDPVSPKTKDSLEGKTFLFPRRLTVGELRERLIARLRTDYAVGHVDVEIGEDGTVEYLALGSRAAGIGPTLPPETAAVAIRADPAYAASAGDLVQVWDSNSARRVLTAELRGVADDVVTLAIDAADTPKLDQKTHYRLVTLPVDDRPDREFASLLRAADETMAAIEVGEGSPVAGQAVRDLGVTIAAITGAETDVATLPSGGRTIAAGDVLYAIGPPEALRKLEDGTAPGGGTEPGEPDAPTAKDGEDPLDREADARSVEAADDAPPVEPAQDGHPSVSESDADRDPLADAVPEGDDGEASSDDEVRGSAEGTDGDEPLAGDHTETDEPSGPGDGTGGTTDLPTQADQRDDRFEDPSTDDDHSR